MRIIVLQLARLGDIVQTLPALQGLKKANPNCELTLVVRSTFADAARLSPHVDALVEFPTADILGPVALDASAKPESLARLIKWLADHFLDQEYDQLLNLTFSPASAYLASLVKAKERRGVCVSKNPNGVAYSIADAWSQYFFAQVIEQNFNIIHINDLFCRIAGVNAETWPLELLEAPSAGVRPKAPGDLRIGIQISASNPEKTLNEELWARLCARLLEKHPTCELVFFGASNDLPHIETVIRFLTQSMPRAPGNRVVVVAGKHRFHENSHWIRSCDWIIAPDTSIVHLASAIGTRVLQIPIGKVRPDDTGPYGEGHRVVYPARADGDQLAEEIARIISGDMARPFVAENMTRLARCSDGSLRNEIVPLNFAAEESGSFFSLAYYLLAEFRCGGRQEDIGIPMLGAPDQPGALDRVVAAYDALCTIRRLSQYGQHYCLKMLESINDINLIKDQMAKIAEIEGLLGKLQNSVPLVKPLIDTWRVAKDVAYSPAADIGGLEEVLALTEGCYRELGQNVEIVQQLLQTAVDAAQRRAAEPKAAQKTVPLPSNEVPKDRV